MEYGELPTGDGPQANYLLALCDGLKELHARGVVHRDLKPANILFRKNGDRVLLYLKWRREDGLPSPVKFKYSEFVISKVDNVNFRDIFTHLIDNK